MNYDNKFPLLIDLIDFDKYTKTHRREGWQNLQIWEVGFSIEEGLSIFWGWGGS